MVFVLDKYKRPLMPCSEKRARLMLERGHAVVHQMAPFTIRLRDRTAAASQLQPLRLKLDPGSKTTGIAVLREDYSEKSEAIFLGVINHKASIKSNLDTRRALRRDRRNRKTRYRKPRFLNRRREDGWLPPSLIARVSQTVNIVNKLTWLLPVTAISTEHVKFDTQLLHNPGISGVEYQQGELWGYEIREYLLEKWGRKCAYCGKENTPLEIEHVNPKSSGGTDRINNLTLACNECNEEKGNKLPNKWLAELLKSKKPIDGRRAENLLKVMARLNIPLKDAAMMNATRWRLFNELKNSNLPVECGTGARTKKQRIEHGLPKTHYYDACCVGISTPATMTINQKYISIWSATGRGTRKMCNTNRYGFPIAHRNRMKTHFGFRTGDMVMANVPDGKYKGRWIGRIAVRSSGYFDIKDCTGKRMCQGISHKHIRLLQHNNGWQYEKEELAG